MKKRKGIIAVAMAATMFLSMGLTGCKQEEYVATVDGEKITKTAFMEVLIPMQIARQMEYGKKEIWDTKIEGKSLKDIVKEDSLEMLVFNEVQLKKAKELGLSLTKEDKEKAKEELKRFKEATGEAELKERLAERQWTEETLVKMIEQEMLLGKLQEKISFQDFDKTFEETYKDDVKVSHILVSTMDQQTGQPLAEEKQAEAKKKAEEALAKVKAGEDFNKVVEQYNEDPGLQLSGGAYVFGKGEMVPEFEKAAYEIKENEVTPELVKTSYGYHIIKRLPKTEEDKQKRKEQVKNQFLQTTGRSVYEQKVLQWKDEAKVEKNKAVWDAIVVKEVEMEFPETGAGTTQQPEAGAPTDIQPEQQPQQ